MTENQKFKGLQEGNKKLETQLQSIGADTSKKFESLESNQKLISSHLQETRD